jgi:glutathione synthase
MTKPIKLGVVMDRIATVNKKKDSTLAMLWEAQARGYKIYYFEQKDLFLEDSVPYGNAKILTFNCEAPDWYKFEKEERVALADLNVILMRKDPPFNEEYIYSTYILEYAERLGTLVVNKPSALRDANEKLFATFFPQCCPHNLVSQSSAELHAFWQQYKDIVVKPLNSMGGESIFRLQHNEVNSNVIFETLTQKGRFAIMAQAYIPGVVDGDKRIILIDGKPIPHALVRIPQGNDWRGNLAVGAKGVVQPLTEHDMWICEQVGPELSRRGLLFAGIDVIGKYLTEINVTSPTCIREIDDACSTNISGVLMDCIEKRLNNKVPI